MLGMADISDNVVAIAVILIAMMVPIVAILSKHQLKMTALMRENQAPASDQILNELRDLKNIVAQQAYALDTLSQSQKQLEARLTTTPRLQDSIHVSG
jgi:hypothetical protein